MVSNACIASLCSTHPLLNLFFELMILPVPKSSRPCIICVYVLIFATILSWAFYRLPGFKHNHIKTNVLKAF